MIKGYKMTNSELNRRVLTMALLSEVVDERAVTTYLTVGNYRYFNVTDSYSIFERPIVIYNISIKEALLIGRRFGCADILFVDMTNDNEVCHQIWTKDEQELHHDMKLAQLKSVRATNADEYYIQVSGCFQHQLPIVEHIQKINAGLALRETIFDVARLIQESLDQNRTGYSRYCKRGQLYGKWVVVV